MVLMIIRKFNGKVRVNGKVKNKTIYAEKWLTSYLPDHERLIVKHENEDWLIGNKNEWGIFELIVTVKDPKCPKRGGNSKWTNSSIM
jgi:hypothetical protein